jgi:hypothetical protein
VAKDFHMGVGWLCRRVRNLGLPSPGALNGYSAPFQGLLYRREFGWTASAGGADSLSPRWATEAFKKPTSARKNLRSRPIHGACYLAPTGFLEQRRRLLSEVLPSNKFRASYHRLGLHRRRGCVLGKGCAAVHQLEQSRSVPLCLIRSDI